MVKHVVEVGYLAGFVPDDREAEAGAGDLINVLDPAVMAVDGVGGKADELDTTLGELGLEFGKGTKFCVIILSAPAVLVP